MLCPFHRVCCGGSAQQKPGGTLVWVQCLVLPVHLKHVNPLIYYLRNNRLRSAFKQFLKDPLGSSAFIETPHSRRNREKQKVNGVAIKKRDGETTKTGQIREVQIDVNQTKQEYSAVENRNDRLILAINNLRTQDPCISITSFSWWAS